MTLELFDLPGPPADAGHRHGRALRGLLGGGFRTAYLRRLGVITRTDPADQHEQARRWMQRLPEHYQLEIEGMAAGAGVPVADVATFLYADIARPTASIIGDAERELAGPMCSAAAGGTGQGPWVARNCDWLYATLSRGVAAVVHRAPNRIPVLAVGIRGDIDVDTGLNAEGLWLHLHTLAALDDPPRDRTSISWLFWAREALETCATLDELERFIEATSRDRGVLVVAAEAASGEAAVFECSRGGHRRQDRSGPWLAATNHTLDKVIDAERARVARPGSTVARLCALRQRLDERPPTRLPDELMTMLGDDAIEMRTPRHLRTIYSAVACPQRGELWFAAGDDRGRPAASTGRWSHLDAGRVLRRPDASRRPAHPGGAPETRTT